MNRKELRAEIIAKIKNLSGMAKIRISSATVLELLDELDSTKQLVKELCDEWNEGCEKNCSSYGHDEECAGTNLAVAKRNLNQQLAAAQAKLKAQEELLGEADKLLIDCWYMTSENFWHRNPINLFREKLRTARGRA